MWNDPSRVIECLARYASNEGHSTRNKTVCCLAEQLMHDPYAASGEEIDAIIRALQLGLQHTLIS